MYFDIAYRECIVFHVDVEYIILLLYTCFMHFCVKNTAFVNTIANLIIIKISYFKLLIALHELCSLNWFRYQQRDVQKTRRFVFSTGTTLAPFVLEELCMTLPLSITLRKAKEKSGTRIISTVSSMF